MNSLDTGPVWRAIANNSPSKTYRGKRAFDIVGALGIAAVFAPVAAAAALLVWQQSGRPILFRHRRDRANQARGRGPHSSVAWHLRPKTSGQMRNHGSRHSLARHHPKF